MANESVLLGTDSLFPEGGWIWQADLAALRHRLEVEQSSSSAAWGAAESSVGDTKKPNPMKRLSHVGMMYACIYVHTRTKKIYI